MVTPLLRLATDDRAALPVLAGTRSALNFPPRFCPDDRSRARLVRHDDAGFFAPPSSQPARESNRVVGIPKTSSDVLIEIEDEEATSAHAVD